MLIDEPEGFAFLNKFPSIFGHVLVVPRRHVEDVVESVGSAENAAVQAMIGRIGGALQATVPCERVYVASLGSRLSNAHVHWHVAPCPPGLPYAEQQWSLFGNGYLDVPEERIRELADEIRAALVLMS